MANFPIGWNFAYHPGEILKVLWASVEPGGLRKSHTGTPAYPCMDELCFQTALQFLTLLPWPVTSELLPTLKDSVCFVKKTMILNFTRLDVHKNGMTAFRLGLSAPTQDMHASFTQKGKEESFKCASTLTDITSWTVVSDRR